MFNRAIVTLASKRWQRGEGGRIDFDGASSTLFLVSVLKYH